MFKVFELLKATKGKLISGSADAQVNAISIDSRTINENDAFIAIRGVTFDGHNFIQEAIDKGAKAVIVQYQVSGIKCQDKNINLIKVKDTIKALGDIANFQRRKFSIPVIAVTGSNGKTTAKEMIAWVLSKGFCVLKNEGTKNNQIGLPQTLTQLNRNHDIAVLELGANHFGEIGYLAKICQPNIGIITNIGPSHLEFLMDLGGVLKEKYTLIENLERPGIAILSSDDKLLGEKISGNKKNFIFSFGFKHKSDFFVTGIKNNSERLEFMVNKKFKFRLRTPGLFNIYNALAAITVARILGFEYKAIASRLLSFDFPKSRLQVIKLKNIKFLDDTYNSNPASLNAALDTLANFKARGRRIFVMGDMLELGKHKELFHRKIGRYLTHACDTFISVGKLSKLAAQEAKNFGFDGKNIFTCQTSSQARDILRQKISADKDDIVLVKGSRAMKMEGVFK